jgi:hypothetical protein
MKATGSGPMESGHKRGQSSSWPVAPIVEVEEAWSECDLCKKGSTKISAVLKSRNAKVGALDILINQFIKK